MQSVGPYNMTETLCNAELSIMRRQRCYHNNIHTDMSNTFNKYTNYINV